MLHSLTLHMGRFDFLYCQILRPIWNFLNQKCFLKSKRMNWKDMKLGVFMVPCWLVCQRSECLFPIICTVVTKFFIFQRAAGQSIYDKLKLFPALASSPAHVVLRPNARVISSNSTSTWTVVLDFDDNCCLLRDIFSLILFHVQP